jgi:hypothetical protein
VVRRGSVKLGMSETTRRTPAVPLGEVFLRAAASLPEEDERGAVVAEALEYLQRGFDSHYGDDGATDGEILVGDAAYAAAVETIARLDEPRFVAVASRMIRDGAGRIAAGKRVTLELWTPHLGGLLDIISGEGQENAEASIRRAAGEVCGGRG